MKKRECDAIIDVLENLIKEEKRGRQYYTDASKIVTLLSARQLLEKLAMAEVEHLDVLLKEKERMEQLRDRVAEEEIILEQFTFDSTDIPNMDNLVENFEISIPILELFKAGDMHHLFEKCSSADIISLAKKIEMDNFKYLVDSAKKMVTRSAFDRLINLAFEEKEHFLWLQRLQKYS